MCARRGPCKTLGMPSPTRGLLLVNLGTPAAPERPAVRAYLREFLSDPRVFELAQQQWVVPSLRVVPPFYDHPSFIESFAAVGQPVLAEFRPDHVVMSFHGLPERHMKKGDPTGAHCLATATCCDAIGPA